MLSSAFSIIEVKAKSFADREIRYTLKAQGKGAGTFNIGPTSGIVKLAKELDYEDLRQPKSYQLVVTATEDSGGFSTSVDLVIKVTDVNDNAPRFELPDYQAHNIDEDVPIGTSILKVKATDMDTGRNAEITYSLDKEDFTIDSKGNIYSNKRLDADVNNTYVLTVKATDRGEPPLTGTATVRIYTENKNDEAPKFSQDVYTPNVDENAGPGEPSFRVFRTFQREGLPFSFYSLEKKDFRPSVGSPWGVNFQGSESQYRER